MKSENREEALPSARRRKLRKFFGPGGFASGSGLRATGWSWSWRWGL